MMINERIFHLLDKQNKTAKDLGKFIGVNASSISAWKNEGSFPSSKYIIGISEFFNVSIEYLFTGIEDSNHISLSESQQELIDTYDQLDRRGQHRVHTIIYEELDRIESQINKASTDSQGSYLYSSRHEEPTCIVCEDTHDYGTNHTHSISVLGYVAAGEPILAVENIEGYFPMPVDRLPNAETFLLKVQGESMVNAGILDGDLVLVEQQATAENGEKIVALVNDSATVKTFYKEDGYFRLQPENDEMDPILVNDLQIVGKVIGVLRFLS